MKAAIETAIKNAAGAAPAWAEYMTIDNLGFSRYWSSKPFMGNSNGFTMWCSTPGKIASGPFIHGAEEQLIKLN